MRKFQIQICGKIYEIKRQYPVFNQFEKRMNEVKRELNKDDCKRK